MLCSGLLEMSFIPAPAYLKGGSSQVSKEHSILRFSGGKFEIGRSTEADLLLKDVNISRKQCVFSFHNDIWSVTDFSSNGVRVNNVKVRKNQPVSLKHGDTVLLSDLGKYRWIFNLGVPDLNDETKEPPRKKPRLGDEREREDTLLAEKKRLRETLKARKLLAQARLVRENAVLETAFKKGQQRQAELREEKAMLVSRLEAAAKNQAVKDREAREALRRETEGKADREEIRKQFEETLRHEREKLEEANKSLLAEMEEKIGQEEALRVDERKERDEQLDKLKMEKHQMEDIFSKEKEEMEKSLKDLQDRLEKDNLSREVRDEEWKAQVSLMNKTMEEKMKLEKEEAERALKKEKDLKESLRREMEVQMELKETELKRLADKLEGEKATRALEMELIMGEKERCEEESRRKEEDLRQQQLRLQEEHQAKMEEIERKKEKMMETEAITKNAEIETALDRGFLCPTCLDIFIRPIALNCGHT